MPNAHHSSVVSFMVLVACPAALAFVTAGCGGGGQVTPPLTAADVRGGDVGYQHRLHVNFYMLCEQNEGRLRCSGLHPLEVEEDGWTSFPDGFSSVSLGGLLLCGLRDGQVVCWGEDPTGESHVALNEQLCTDQAFHGLTGVRELALNDETGCVVTAAGVVRCWGVALGPQTEDLYGLHDLVQDAHGLAVGTSQGCALTDAGVRCWGDPVGYIGGEYDDESLASGETYGVPVPDPVQVVVGESFACSRSRDRRVYCWGYDMEGSLGLGDLAQDEQHPPRELPGLRAVDLVASETGVCARSEDGRSYCWGSNAAGQLGLGHTQPVVTPTHVPSLDGVVDLALGGDTVCARGSDGGVRCAGDVSPLLSGNALQHMPPQRMPSVVATRLHLSEREACVSTAAGLRCFGNGGYLQRGHQEAAAGWVPDAVTGDVAQHTYFSGRPCTRWQDGRLRCVDPGLIVEQTGTQGFATSGTRACFVDAAQQVQCWARNGTDLPAPVGLADAAAIAMADGRVCAVTTRGGLACRPTVGQGGPTSHLTASLTDVRALALGGDRTCVLRQAGQVSCWEGDTPIPGDITGVTSMAYGLSQMCVVQAGRVRCLRFGAGHMLLEEPLPDVDDVVELASGGTYFCARNTRGEVRCWGRNYYSQFGVLMPTLRLDFIAVSDTEVRPAAPASLGCTGSGEGDDYADDGYEEYEPDEGDGYEY